MKEITNERLSVEIPIDIKCVSNYKITKRFLTKFVALSPQQFIKVFDLIYVKSSKGNSKKLLEQKTFSIL